MIAALRHRKAISNILSVVTENEGVKDQGKSWSKFGKRFLKVIKLWPAKPLLLCMFPSLEKTARWVEELHERLHSFF